MATAIEVWGSSEDFGEGEEEEDEVCGIKTGAF